MSQYDSNLAPLFILCSTWLNVELLPDLRMQRVSAVPCRLADLLLSFSSPLGLFLVVCLRIFLYLAPLPPSAPPPSVVELMIRHRADAPCPSGHLLWLPIRLLKWETRPPCVKSSENNAVITIPAWPATVTHPYVLPYQAHRAPTALDAAQPRTSVANERF